MIALHRARFLEWRPAGVVALATNGDGSVLAAAREDGDIELYEVPTSHCFQRLPGHRDACLTCVALVDEEETKGGLTSRLFSAGLDGTLVEWDVEQRQAGPAADSLGGAVWQLAPEPRACVKPGTAARVAAACDDGCVRIFLAEAGVPGLVYARTLPRVEGRTLAIAWHPSGEVLASAGTDGCIHLWGIASGCELLRITARDGSQHSSDSCIWALLVLPEGTIVSGDSGGKVQFWDGRFGTLLARFTQHQADVLQLASSPDGSMVFATGVDPQVAVFQRLLHPDSSSADAKQQPWAYLTSKRPHTHDVRAMCMAAGKHAPERLHLFTGGNDTQLFSYSGEHFLKEHPVAVSPCPQLPLLQITQAATAPGAAHGDVTQKQQEQQPAQQQQEQGQPLLMCAQRTHVDVWQLPCPGSAPLSLHAEPAEGALVPLVEPPQHLLRLMAQAGRHITAACISHDRGFLAYSDSLRLSCFALGQAQADKGAAIAGLAPTVVDLPADFPPAYHLAFRPGSTELVACCADGILRFIDVAACHAQQQQAASGSGSAPHVMALRAVHDLQYKSSVRRDRQRSAARRLMPLVDLMAVSPDGSWLAVVVRQRVHVLSLETWKLAHSLPALVDPQPAITALAFTADSSTLVVVTSSHQVAAYRAVDGQATDWSQQYSACLPTKLRRMPGTVASIASCPAAPSSLFLASSQACCHLDLAHPLDGGSDEQQGPGRKRRRAAHKPVLSSEPPGSNCRMVYCSDPVLHAGYLGPDALLVVEQPWEEVHKGISAPMHRHRYGT